MLRPLSVVQCQPNWSNELHFLVCFGGGGGGWSIIGNVVLLIPFCTSFLLQMPQNRGIVCNIG